MLINDEVLENLEKLSMLKIDKDKKESLKKELSEIVAYVENLNELEYLPNLRFHIFLNFLFLGWETSFL